MTERPSDRYIKPRKGSAEDVQRSVRRRGKMPWITIFTATAAATPLAVELGKDLVEEPGITSPDGATAEQPRYRTSAEQYQGDAQIESARQALRETYGIELLFGPDPDDTRYPGEGLSVEEARTSVEYLHNALSRYPRAFLERVGLPRAIRISTEMRTRDDTFNPGQQSADIDGYADAARNQIVLEFSPQEGFQRFLVVFDHEYYHWLDARRDTEAEDAKWEGEMRVACQCQPYSNYRQGESVRAGQSTRRDLTDWFFDLYGSRTPAEDRATIASIIMNPLQHALFLERLQTMGNRAARESLHDRYLSIRADYYEWSDGAIDEAFWNRIIEDGRERLRRRAEEEKGPVATYNQGFEATYEDNWYTTSDDPPQDDLTEERPPVQ